MKIQFACLFIFLFVTVPVLAQINPLAPVRLDNPRDTMKTFMGAMNDYREGTLKGDSELASRIEDAISTLDLSEVTPALRKERGRELAIKLKEVVDRHIVIDYSLIDQEVRVGNKFLPYWRLKGSDIKIARVTSGEREGDYLFSPSTVARIDEYFDKVRHLPYKEGSGKGALYEEPWSDKIPDWAQQRLLVLPNWQWLGIFISILLGLILKVVVQRLIHMLDKLVERTKIKWDDHLIDAIEKPSGMVAASLFWYASVFILRFQGTSLLILIFIVQFVLGVSIIWTVYRLVDVFTDYMKIWASRTDSTLDDQLVPLLQKTLRIFVVVTGFLILFQNMGFNVVSVLAGLGLGGLAFALAAKDALANLFGSIMVFMDRPFRVGDWIIAGGAEGTVEEVGFRSTRIRTFYNSLISVPNSQIANANIDNMGLRKYRRIKAMLGLTYDTPPEKMEAFLEGVKNIVKANEFTRKDNFHVVFHSYGDFSLNVLLYCFLDVPDWATEMVERQNIYLEIMRLAKDVGVEFAFPTQTLHMESFPGKDSAPQFAIDPDKLARAAKEFGPQGARAKPSGLGLFTPPYKENQPS